MTAVTFQVFMVKHDPKLFFPLISHEKHRLRCAEENHPISLNWSERYYFFTANDSSLSVNETVTRETITGESTRWQLMD